MAWGRFRTFYLWPFRLLVRTLGFQPKNLGALPGWATNLRINYPETDRFETVDWLWCNGAQRNGVRVNDWEMGLRIKVRFLIGQQNT
jgi:hypothetical protein